MRKNWALAEAAEWLSSTQILQQGDIMYWRERSVYPRHHFMLSMDMYLSSQFPVVL